MKEAWKKVGLKFQKNLTQTKKSFLGWKCPFVVWGPPNLQNQAFSDRQANTKLYKSTFYQQKPTKTPKKHKNKT